MLLLAGCVGSLGDDTPLRPPPAEEVDVSDTFRCRPTEAEAAPARVWRLSHGQFRRVTGSLLGLDDLETTLDLGPDAEGVVFTNEDRALRVRDDELANYRRHAATLAERALTDGTIEARWPCVSTGGADCGRELVAEFGREAFRRPLTDDERDRYESLYGLAEEQLGGDAGARKVIEAMLQSPHLLYRSERGPDDARGPADLTEHELATALSFYFWDSAPDAELADLADSERLYEELPTQVARMADDPRWLSRRQRFVRELLDLAHLADVEKSDSVFPDFDALRPQMTTELDSFLARLFQSDTPALGALFDSREAQIDDTLASFCGVSAAAPGEWTMLGEDRRGLFTRGAFLSATAGRERASPVERGRILRTRVMCDVIPPPPDGVNTSLPDPEPGMSERELVTLATSEGSCFDCHSRMNDLGFALGQYDAIGQLRDVDAFGQPIVTGGVLMWTADIDGPFADLNELLDRLRDSPQVSRCMTLQAFRYAAGRPAGPGDQCALVDMIDAAGSGSDMNLNRLLEAYPLTRAFRAREVSE